MNKSRPIFTLFNLISYRYGLLKPDIEIVKYVEIFLYFADISDMQDKSLHIPDIEVFCGN